VEANRVVRRRSSHIFCRQLADRWRYGCQPYAPTAFYTQEDSWYSFLLRDWVDPRVTVRLEGLGQLKKKTRDLNELGYGYCSYSLRTPSHRSHCYGTGTRTRPDLARPATDPPKNILRQSPGLPQGCHSPTGSCLPTQGTQLSCDNITAASNTFKFPNLWHVKCVSRLYSFKREDER
jgi:hypothetical protein